MPKHACKYVRAQSGLILCDPIDCSILAWKNPMDRGAWQATTRWSQREGRDWARMLKGQSCLLRGTMMWRIKGAFKQTGGVMFQLRLLLEEYLWGNYLNSQSLSFLFCKHSKWTFAVWIKDTKLRSLMFPLGVGRITVPQRRLGPSPRNLWLLLRLMAMGKFRWAGRVKVANQLILRWGDYPRLSRQSQYTHKCP